MVPATIIIQIIAGMKILVITWTRGKKNGGKFGVGLINKALE